MNHGGCEVSTVLIFFLLNLSVSFGPIFGIYNFTMRLIIYTLISFVSVCYAQLATTPQNVAAFAGNDIELACASSNSSPTMSWYEFISNAAGQVICINGASSNPPNPEIYTFGDPVEGVYNLGIELLSSSGGRYGCQQLAPITAYAYANIIVFEETPLCTFSFPPGDNAVEEGDEYSMTCSVSYLGDAGWAPKMEWKDDNGVISDVIDNSEEGKLDVTVTRSAALDHHGFEYSARIHFVAYDGTLPDNTATNIPTFTEIHTFDAIVVHYSPRDIEFTEEKAEYVPGDEIVCSASGRPQPEYTWRNINSGLVIETDTLVITDEMLSEQQSYECEATNIIKGTTRNNTRSLTFSVVTTPVPTTLPTTQPTTPSTTPDPGESNPPAEGLSTRAIAGIAVGVAIIVIILIALLVYFCCRTKKTPAPSANTHHNPVHTKPAPIHGDQVRYADTNEIGDQYGTGTSFPDEHPPPYNTYDRNSASNPYEPFETDPRNRNAEGVVYADLALDDTPRSRKPIQVYDNTEYADIRRV